MCFSVNHLQVSLNRLLDLFQGKDVLQIVHLQDSLVIHPHFFISLFFVETDYRRPYRNYVYRNREGKDYDII